MKYRFLALAAALLLLCPSCSAGTANSGQTESADPVQTGIGANWASTDEWPVNAYTAGVPVPPGEVRQVLLDEANGFCAVSLDGVSRAEVDAWREELASSGFRLLAGVEEDVKGTVPSGSVAIGEVYTDGSVSCSVSHSADLLALYCSLTES